MSHKDSQKEKLDRIGRRLLETARLTDGEIEQIINRPQLFEAVKARIKTAEQLPKAKARFGGGLRLPVFQWPKAVGAFAVLAVLLIGAFSLFVFRKYDPQPLVKNPPDREIPSEPAEVEKPQPHIEEPTPEIEKTVNFAGQKKNFTKRAAVKNQALDNQTKGRKAVSAKRQPQKENKSEGVFFALASFGNLAESGEDLRLVRTELSRSELFALGVDIPVENDVPKIKTDLLVGTDGVARAIRIVE